MKTHEIAIQDNRFNAVQIPLTQEDHFGGAVDKYDLFHRFLNENNGNETVTKVGCLVKYYGNYFIVWHGSIRYLLPEEDVTIKQMRYED